MPLFLGTQGINANGMFSGLYYCIATMNGENYLQGVLDSIRLKGFSDKIMTIFTIPAFALIGFSGLTLTDIKSGILRWITRDFKANPVMKGLTQRPATLDGYTPRNQKLRTYPYMYLGFNAIGGTPHLYRYEDFPNGNPSFKMISEINPNPNIYFIPQNYRGATGDSMSDATSLQGYPTISWVSDYFNTWLAQNSQILSLNIAQEQYNYDMSKISDTSNYLGNAVSQGTNADVGGFIGSTGNYALNMVNNAKNHEFYIKNQLAQIEKQQMLPNSANAGSGNGTLLGYDLMDNNIFTRYTIKHQFAERIDKFFDMFGYLYNTVKVPNLFNRPNWNYVKTVGANIIGDIPQNDLQEIKNMFDNGITLWHNPATFLDYSQNNR